MIFTIIYCSTLLLTVVLLVSAIRSNRKLIKSMKTIDQDCAKLQTTIQETVALITEDELADKLVDVAYRTAALQDAREERALVHCIECRYVAEGHYAAKPNHKILICRAVLDKDEGYTVCAETNKNHDCKHFKSKGSLY